MKKHIKQVKSNVGKYIKGSTDVNTEEFDKTGNDSLVFISIKNVQSNYQCFSDWTKQELSKFWDFNKRLHGLTWKQVYQTGGSNNKTGLAYTIIPRNKYPDNQFMSNLDDSINMFELRVDNEIRVHGFRIKSVFYLCFLDRAHAICK